MDVGSLHGAKFLFEAHFGAIDNRDVCLKNGDCEVVRNTASVVTMVVPFGDAASEVALKGVPTVKELTYIFADAVVKYEAAPRVRVNVVSKVNYSVVQDHVLFKLQNGLIELFTAHFTVD